MVSIACGAATKDSADPDPSLIVVRSFLRPPLSMKEVEITENQIMIATKSREAGLKEAEIPTDSNKYS
jgi:hypothetical protein